MGRRADTNYTWFGYLQRSASVRGTADNHALALRDWIEYYYPEGFRRGQREQDPEAKLGTAREGKNTQHPQDPALTYIAFRITGKGADLNQIWQRRDDGAAPNWYVPPEGGDPEIAPSLPWPTITRAGVFENSGLPAGMVWDENGNATGTPLIQFDGQFWRFIEDRETYDADGNPTGTESWRDIMWDLGASAGAKKQEWQIYKDSSS